MKKHSSFIAGILLVLGSVGIVTGLYKFVKFWMGSSNVAEKVVFYEVKKNMTPTLILKELESLGIISNARMFYWYGRLTGKLNRFKSGDYRFTNHMRPDDIMNTIMSGVSYGVPITIPEGYTKDQIAGVLEKYQAGYGEHFLQLCNNAIFIKSLNLFVQSPRNLEGYLFPDTYFVTRKTPVEELIHQMVKKYRTIMTPEKLAQAQAMGFNEHQVVTLASIVERETGALSERPLVASVFHNRLQKHMKLQSDPTVIYGMGKSYEGNISKKDLLTPTPYNTYTRSGLPVGPIGNPGKEALIATLNPAKTDYLYFVSHNDGTHEFTSTYADHQRAVVKFQLDRKAREGHSWRELRQSAQKN